MKGTAWAIAGLINAGWIVYGQDAAPPNFNVPDIPITTPIPAANVPDISQIDQIFKQSSLGKQADERRLHIEWRTIANEVANDPEVIAARESTSEAHTDFEKRQRLRMYYNLYYDRMMAKTTNPDVKAAIDALKKSHLTQTAQPRVRPETDSPMSTPLPTWDPNKKHHRKHERHKSKKSDDQSAGLPASGT
jgi:hypothetical protein